MSTVRLPILSSSSPALPDDKSSSAQVGAGVSPGAGEQLMQVGDLASETGKTVRAIHLYEEMELLKPAGRSKGRYRLYGPEALVRIRWIGKLQDLGFSLTDIKAIVKGVELEGRQSSAPSAMAKVREVYKEKLAATRSQIERLRMLEREILASLDYLDTCGTACEPDKSLTACPSCNHHDKEREVPDLVAGLRASPSDMP